MASTTPAKRVTRARAAANKPSDALSKKSTTSKVTKNTTARKTKPAVEATDEEIVEPKRTSTRTTTKTPTLAALPRRRIKVTPLDAPAADEHAAPQNSAETAKPKRGPKNKSEPVTNELQKEKSELEQKPVASKSRSRSVKSTVVENPKEEAFAPKPRGRPKKVVVEEEKPKAQGSKATRQTRARDKAKVDADDAPTAPAATRKKVTFQDLPEDDKENQPIASKKGSSKKETSSITGMRARPVRKPISTSMKKKATASTTSNDEEVGTMALSPKKITQVTRATTPDQSDEEDELSGAKTPVRDLSLSPKRRPNMGALTSPSKKLEYTQSLAPDSPTKATDLATIMSPARRPPGSPFKNALTESPRRGDAAPVFPSHSQVSNTAAIALLPTTQSSSVLLQSPKRGPVDSTIFQQSTVKQNKTPLKASLLSSPAKRLFSPSKQKTPAAVSPGKENTPAGTRLPFENLGTPEDIAISSHFRSSVSPQRSVRVHRMSDDELAEELRGDINFDDSILNIRSPFKISKPVTSAQVFEPIRQEESVVTEDAEIYQASVNGDEMVNDEYNEFENSLEHDDETIVLNEAEADIAKAPELQQASQHEDIEVNDETMSVNKDSTSIDPSPVKTISATAVSRDTQFREDDESSEDELAADETPNRAISAFRSSLTGATIRGRQSTGIPSNLSRQMGFTPLASQMNGWLASSPGKKSQRREQNTKGLFSPIAAQHIPGEVTVSRQSTPQSKRSSVISRPSDLRMSVIGRSPCAPSAVPTPDKPTYFADEMAATEMEEQLRDNAQDENVIEDLHIEEDVTDDQVAPDTEEQVVQQNNDELTTDLVNFTNASDTALIDFTNLAQEADELAPLVDDNTESSVESAYGDENIVPVDDKVTQSNDPPVDDYESEASPATDKPVVAQGFELVDEQSTKVEEAPISTEVEDEAEASIGLQSPRKHTSESIDVVTPVQRDFTLPRFVNTVVSKVPLRPEADDSPIKIPKKRSRSFSNEPGSAKRPNFGPSIAALAANAMFNPRSPERRIRSAAPSPAHTTPGQMSFALDDFGDSTLDGIEIPEDELGSDDTETHTMNFEVTDTPATVKSTRSRKSVTGEATPTASRVPLKAVGNGVLHGATVLVDVHTTEGADASGIFVELLTQMGAKCVKEWRWNPRASMSNPADEPLSSSKVGITHVVYKDGGKRTLEKVRDTKGEVWCVGVGWVLDCERENKWLDESAYAVDSSIMPRGGSRRRKSMEPRALINQNGSLSVSRNRRSVSFEVAEKAKSSDFSHLSTPVRRVLSTSSIIPSAAAKEPDAFGDETEISSTYNSPTTTMNVKMVAEDDMATPTELVNWDPRTAATPTTSTPYLMEKGRGLVQMSCPPKQISKGIFEDDNDSKENHDGDSSFFPVTGKIEDAKDEKLRKKLMDARRKTLGVGNAESAKWKPKVGSPLGRRVD